MLRFLVLLFTLLLLSCGTSKTTSSSAQNDNGYLLTDQRNESGTVSSLDKPDRNRTLQDHLLGIPGLSLSSGLIVVRGGVTSFGGIQEPLYVVDGNTIGGGFANVNGMVRVQDIGKVTVLKGSSAAIYGTRGQNGVVVITTRKD